MEDTIVIKSKDNFISTIITGISFLYSIYLVINSEFIIAFYFFVIGIFIKIIENSLSLTVYLNMNGCILKRGKKEKVYSWKDFLVIRYDILEGMPKGINEFILFSTENKKISSKLKLPKDYGIKFNEMNMFYVNLIEPINVRGNLQSPCYFTVPKYTVLYYLNQWGIDISYDGETTKPLLEYINENKNFLFRKIDKNKYLIQSNTDIHLLTVDFEANELSADNKIIKLSNKWYNKIFEKDYLVNIEGQAIHCMVKGKNSRLIYMGEDVLTCSLYISSQYSVAYIFTFFLMLVSIFLNQKKMLDTGTTLFIITLLFFVSFLCYQKGIKKK